MSPRTLFPKISFVVLLLFTVILAYNVNGESVHLEFDVLASGDISGYTEETYLIARNEEELEEIWKNHSAPLLCPEQWIELWENRTGVVSSTAEPPEINFSQAMVVCVFMGERRTAGYNITIEDILVEDTVIHVEIVKNKPAEGWAVAQVLTYPHVFASMERSEMDVVFEVTEEDGSEVDHILPDMPKGIFILAVFTTLSVMVIVYARKQSLPDTSQNIESPDTCALNCVNLHIKKGSKV